MLEARLNLIGAGPPLLEGRNLTRYYNVRASAFARKPRLLRAVDGVSLALHPGESLGLVGETGSGKTTTARMLLLLEQPSSGEILFRGERLVRAPKRLLRAYRSAIQAVFQDPWGSLNPRMRIHDFVTEPAAINRHLTRSELAKLAGELLTAVGLSPSDGDKFPHQFSGGQRQRIVIARSLSLDPVLIVLDEPVSSLDVSIRAQILNLLRDLHAERGLSFLLIAHDLATVRYLCQQVAVMYLGRIVEQGPVETVLERPSHPYTKALVAASSPFVQAATARIRGDIASAIDPPPGCHFNPRCPEAFAPCTAIYPGVSQLGANHWVRCHLFERATTSPPAEAN